jgi:hypothetical protein
MPRKSLEHYKKELEKLENKETKTITEKRNQTRFKNMIKKMEHNISEKEHTLSKKEDSEDKKILKELVSVSSELEDDISKNAVEHMKLEKRVKKLEYLMKETL